MDHTNDGSGAASTPSGSLDQPRSASAQASDEHKHSVSVIRFAPRASTTADELPAGSAGTAAGASPDTRGSTEPGADVALPAAEIRVAPRDMPPAAPRRRGGRTLRLLAGACALLAIGWWVGLNTHTVDAAAVSTEVHRSFGIVGTFVASAGRNLRAKIEGLIHPSASVAASPSTEALDRAVRDLAARVDQVHRADEQVRELRGEVGNLRAGVERAQAELAAKLAQAVERVERLEQARAGPRVPPLAQRPEPTAAGLPGPTAPAAVQRPSPAGPALASLPAPDVSRDQTVLRQWTVREVLNGMALLEGPAGVVGVSPGQTVPGLGRVEAITRQGGGWVVATSRGVVRSREAPR